MLSSDDLLHTIPHSILIPRQQTQKLLKRSRCHAGLQGDRLNALSIQVGQLSPKVNRQVLTTATIHKAIRKPTHEPFQFRDELSQSFGIHAKSSENGSFDPNRSFVKKPISGKTTLAL
jgi:hypothetical protein